MEPRRVLVALTVVVVLVVPSGAARAGDGSRDRRVRSGPAVLPDAQGRIVELINRERVAVGLARLRVDEAARRVAERWSRQLALEGGLRHNERYLSPDSLERLHATMVGENVAVGDSLDHLHQLFMASPPHRGNVLQPDYTLVGVAAVRTPTGRIYLTEDFLTRPTVKRPRRR